MPGMDTEPEVGLNEAITAVWGTRIDEALVGHTSLPAHDRAIAGGGWPGWSPTPLHTRCFVRRPTSGKRSRSTNYLPLGLRRSRPRSWSWPARRRGGLDVRLGVSTITMNLFLAAGLVEDLHVIQVPVLLGRGFRSGTSWRVCRAVRSVCDCPQRCAAPVHHPPRA